MFLPLLSASATSCTRSVVLPVAGSPITRTTEDEGYPSYEILYQLGFLGSLDAFATPGLQGKHLGCCRASVIVSCRAGSELVPKRTLLWLCSSRILPADSLFPSSWVCRFDDEPSSCRSLIRGLSAHLRGTLQSWCRVVASPRVPR